MRKGEGNICRKACGKAMNKMVMALWINGRASVWILIFLTAMDATRFAWHISAMPYTVEVVLAELQGPENDQAMPAIRLPETYLTIEQASDAARAYIKNLNRPAGSAFYKILDEHGHDSGRG
jgi:hypothetical protein